MRVLLFGLLMASCTLGGCSGPPGQPPADPGVSEGPSQEGVVRGEGLEDALEALFRHQFGNNASGAQSGAVAYYLQIDGEDPTPAFMARFSEHLPPVGVGSEWRMGTGIRFYVSDVRRVSATRIECSGGYHEGGLSASGNRYVLVLESGKWTVSSDVMEWIA